MRTAHAMAIESAGRATTGARRPLPMKLVRTNSCPANPTVRGVLATAALAAAAWWAGIAPVAAQTTPPTAATAATAASRATASTAGAATAAPAPSPAASVPDADDREVAATADLACLASLQRATTRPAPCLKAADAATLGRLLDLTGQAHLLTEEVRGASEAVFAEIQRRGPATSAQWKQRLRGSIVAWDWATVAQLSSQPEVRPIVDKLVLPTAGVIGSAANGTAPLVWAYGGDRTLRGERFDLAHGTKVVVVFSPGCGFCNRAATALAQDPMRAYFASCSVWVSPVEGWFDLADYRDWSTKHPEFPARLTRDWRGFGLPTPYSFPRIYVYRDGRQVQALVGWPRTGERLDDLRPLVGDVDPATCRPRTLSRS